MNLPVFPATVILVAIVTGLMGMVGCQDPSIAGSGARVEQQRHLPPFTGVVLRLPAHLRVACGTPQSVTVAADDNLLPHIDMRVESGVLVITSEVSLAASQPITIGIGVADLRLLRVAGKGEADLTGVATSELQLAVAGSAHIRATGTAATTRCEIAGMGSIEMTGLAARDLQLITSGKGRIRVAGATAAMLCEVSGMGTIDATHLAAETVVASVSGAGTITTTPIVELDARVSGSGTITYAGRPQVRSRVAGSGAVRAADPRQ